MMDGGSRAAPDLFAALEWSARVAPATEADGLGRAPAERAAAPPIAAAPSPALAPSPSPEFGPSPEFAPSPELALEDAPTHEAPAVRTEPPRPPAPPSPAPPRRATPPAAPPVAATMPAASPAAASAAAASSPPFSGLADMLEPDDVPEPPRPGVRRTSPALDEFEGLLGLFDEPDASPPPAGSKPAPPRARPPSTPKPPRRGTPVIATMPKPGGVAEAAPAVDFPAPGDPAASAQLVAPPLDSASPIVSRVAPVVRPIPASVPEEPEEPTRRRGAAPALWIALTLMLGGALAYVVATQTDLLEGDVIANRDAEAAAADQADLERRKAEQEAKKKEYGTIEIASEPKGARVFELREGPTARFEHLPVDHEYMVMVAAPGFSPRVRVVKGTELAAPVVMDLDPLPAGAAALPLPDERTPKLAPTPSKQTATLELRSNTPGAELGLLVGYTPGVKVVDVDVAQVHRYRVVLAGHEPAEVQVKGRHFEEVGGVLQYLADVKLQPAAPAPPPAAAEDDDALVIDDDEPAAAPAAAPAGKPAPAPSKRGKKKKKKKRRWQGAETQRSGRPDTQPSSSASVAAPTRAPAPSPTPRARHRA
ncbi:MAG: hypothetical protein U0168_25270 [Nannocystaceae bacterium]